MKFKTIFLVFVLMLSYAFTNAQQVRGTITSDGNQTIPFASIFIKENAAGTTCNEFGEFGIPLESGVYHISFQALGYVRVEKEVVISDNDVILNVVLKEQNYQIKEVRVFSGDEDPAYAIMRKSISLATYFQHQVKSYNAKVYLKGGFDMDKVPFLLRKQLKEEGIVEGENYVSESLNEIKFTAPDHYEHTQISKRSTIPNDSEDQVITFINYSFYDVDNEDLISPLSRKAFSFYKFQYEGFFQQGEYYVNKIKVMPRRKNQKLFSGYMYIVDQLWNLHSVDLVNEQFFGKIRVKQVQEQVKDKVWLPVSHNFKIDLKVMGLKMKANYGGSVEYTNVELDNELVVPASVTKAYVAMSKEEEPEEELDLTKNQQKINELLEKEELNNRDMLKLTRLMGKEQEKVEDDKNLELEEWGSNYKIVKDTVKRDSILWDKIRPIPLSENELGSFEIKDSLQVAKQEQSNDSTSLKSNSLFWDIVSGTRFFNSDSSLTVDYSGIVHLKAFDFNTVDGFTYMQNLKIGYEIDSIHSIAINPYMKYAFGRSQFQWKLDNTYFFAPMKRGELKISAGQWANDFNASSGIDPTVNALATLFFKENYMKLHQEDYVFGELGIDISNGLRASAALNYYQFYKLENNSDFAFAYPNKTYRLNNDLEGFNQSWFNSKSSLGTAIGITYTPKYYYRVRKGRKVMQYSDYPTMSLNYEGAFANTLGSQSNYHMLDFRITQELKWSFMYALNYDVSAGYFINNDDMHISQFKHFSTSEVPISLKDWDNTFVLLNDYEHSTNEWYVQAHINYTTPYLLIKNIGFLQNKLWNENLYVHHLTTPQFRNYNELGYGLSNIFLMGSLGAFVGFEQASYRSWGIRASIYLP